MSNSSENRDSQPVSYQEIIDTATSNIPETGDDWFALIKPKIDIPPEEADEADVVELAQHHAEQAVERTGMAVDLDQVTWRATRELRANHGYHRRNFVKLSLNSLQTNGWQEIMKTARHELVHIWQYQNMMYDFPAENRVKASHGSSFERWMPVLNIPKRGPIVLAKWKIKCPECRKLIKQMGEKRAKQVADWIHTSNREVCSRCGDELSEYMIIRNGEQIAVESLPDVLTEYKDRIILYNGQTASARSDAAESTRRTRRLTAFTGIGEATARKLGDDIHYIEEMLDRDDGTLTAPIRSAVTSQYHEPLRDEVQTWYEKALRHRSSDELDPVDQAFLCGDLDWSDPIDNVEGITESESLCLLFRDMVAPEDQLRVTVEAYGELTIQIVEKYDGKTKCARVTIDPPSTALGEEAIMEIPTLNQEEYPVIRDRRDSPEPAVATNPTNSEVFYELHRRKITEVNERVGTS